MSDPFRFVVFGLEDVERLALFNQEMRNRSTVAGVLEARDETYYRRYTGQDGWTVGFEGPSGIIATHHLTWFLEPYRANWLFPTEDLIFRKPTLWWGGWSVHPDFQGQGIGPKLLARIGEFAAQKGYPARIGAFHPSSILTYLGMIRRGQRFIPGIFYDDDGWNPLIAPRECCIAARMPTRTELWVDAGDEGGILAAIEAGMVGIAASENGPPQIGFGQTLSKR